MEISPEPKEKSKNLKINVADEVSVTADLNTFIAITTISRELINDAKKYLKDNVDKKIGFAAPIILCHMALEMQVLSMERFFLKKQGFNNKEIDVILYQNTNIAERKSNEISKKRILFELILKEKIPNNINLDKLNKINKLRNDAIHNGRYIQREEAEEAIAYIEKAIGILEDMFSMLNKKLTE